MKTKSLIILIFTTIIVSCSNNIDKPEKLGNEVILLLKKSNTISDKEYFSEFISLNELNSFWKKTVINEKDREQISSITQDMWKQKIINDFIKIKEKGLKYNIDWENIELIDFIYEIKEKNEVKGLNGKLIFTSNDMKYKIQTTFIQIDDEYKLYEIKDLRKDY